MRGGISGGGNVPARVRTANFRRFGSIENKGAEFVLSPPRLVNAEAERIPLSGKTADAHAS